MPPEVEITRELKLACLTSQTRMAVSVFLSLSVFTLIFRMSVNVVCLGVCSMICELCLNLLYLNVKYI